MKNAQHGTINGVSFNDVEGLKKLFKWYREYYREVGRSIAIYKLLDKDLNELVPKYGTQVLDPYPDLEPDYIYFK